MISNILKAWRGWQHFWFEFDHPVGLALVRIQISAILLWMYFDRQIHSLQSFTDEGMVPRALALPLMPEYFRPPFAWFFWPDSWVVGIHGLFVVLCLVMLLGLGTRWVAWLAWILHIGFIQRNYSILFGADVISCLFLFYLAFSRSEEVFSLRSWLRRRSGKNRGPTTDAVSSAFARLLQIQLAVIYAYTGFEKLKGQSWWDGTALWTVLGNPQMVMVNVDWVRNFPLVISIFTFSTVIFEIYWPAAMLMPKFRKPWMVLGLSFHFGIAALMGLWTFSLTMLAPYWLFLTPTEVEKILKLGRKTV